MSLSLQEQYDRIYTYCYFKVKKAPLAEDLTQETFLRFFSQYTYIRFALFGLPLLTGLFADLSTGPIDNDTLSFLWMLSSLLPFVSLVSITEITRSAAYNMSELEMACKYSLSHVVLARLGILGGLNMMVFSIMVSALWHYGSFGVFRSGIYLLTPFLLTCSLSLFVINRLRSREAAYVCGTLSCFVSISNTFSLTQQRVVLSDHYFFYWAVMVFILLLWATKEIIIFVKKTEDMQWSLL